MLMPGNKPCVCLNARDSSAFYCVNARDSSAYRDNALRFIVLTLLCVQR